MKVVRTARSHQALEFEPDGEDGDTLVIDRHGVVVSDAKAEEYAKVGAERGVEVLVEDAPDGAKTGDDPSPAAASDTPAAPSPVFAQGRGSSTVAPSNPPTNPED